MVNLDKDQIFASLVLIVTGILLGFVPPENQFEFTKVNIVAGHIISIVFSFFCVYLIKIVRGNEQIKKNEVVQVKPLGVWGYYWRGFLTISIAPFFSMLVAHLFKLRFEIPSLPYTITLSTISFFTIVLLIWLLFSKSRKQQLNWVIRMFRGY